MSPLSGPTNKRPGMEGSVRRIRHEHPGNKVLGVAVPLHNRGLNKVNSSSETVAPKSYCKREVLEKLWGFF